MMGGLRTLRNDCNLNSWRDEETLLHQQHDKMLVVIWLTDQERANGLMITASKKYVVDVISGFSAKCNNNVVASTAL